MKTKNLLESFNHAIDGIAHAMRTERNFRIHLLIALLILVAAFVMGVSTSEKVMLVLAIGAVITAEMLNTAIERTVDLITPGHHPTAKIAKDAAAGAVLVAAVTAVTVGYFIFVARIGRTAEGALERLENMSTGATFAALAAVILAAVGFKRLTRPFDVRGGFPSVHSGIAFALVTVIYLHGSTTAVTSIALGLAFLVGQARLEAGFHSIFEVVAGAALGIITTLLVFQLVVG